MNRGYIWLIDLGGKTGTRPLEGYPYNERGVQKSGFDFGIRKLSIKRLYVRSISE